MRVSEIATRGEKDDVALARASPQHRHVLARHILGELVAVTLGELGEVLDLVAVPIAKIRARRDVLVPLVIVNGVLGSSARPEAIDEHAVFESGARRVVIDALNRDLAGHDLAAHPQARPRRGDLVDH